ncbi:MAG: hypothetical protein LBT25_11385 [Candidatus Symbiothrix sp.]|nr:hypothetical protein [Candidatus Symbiothrix sp.]
MKKKFALLLKTGMLAGAMLFFTACPEPDETPSDSEIADMGRKAAVEFCDCYKKESKDECLEQLKDNYKYEYYSSTFFMDAFNESETCGVELIWQTTYNDFNRRIIVKN